MIKVLYICHGNICRSVMAQFMMQQLVDQKGLTNDFYIDSAACTNDEIGNDIYPPAQTVLRNHGIKFTHHAARLVTKEDYENFDLLICMDENNIYRLESKFGKNEKVKMLLNRDVEDPWWTGNYEKVYQDINQGIQQLLKDLQ